MPDSDFQTLLDKYTAACEARVEDAKQYASARVQDVHDMLNKAQENQLRVQLRQLDNAQAVLQDGQRKAAERQAAMAAGNPHGAALLPGTPAYQEALLRYTQGADTQVPGIPAVLDPETGGVTYPGLGEEVGREDTGEGEGERHRDPDSGIEL